MAKSSSRALVLKGGKRKRQVRPARTGWTAAKQRRFLETLAATCNVTLAAETAKISASAAYVRRQKDATFRQGWERALATGYAQLELMMLERALHGVEKVIVARDGSQTIMREYKDATALALLKMHRDAVQEAETPVPDLEYEEARERIMARIERLREQA